MPSGGVSGYAAINARVRVMYSNLLSRQEMDQLCEAPDFNALLVQLKHTAYAPYLDKVRDRDLTPRRAAFQMRIRLAEAYTSIIHVAPSHTHDLLTQLYRFYEVSNLKAILRGIVTGASWERVKFVLFPFGSETTFPDQAAAESGSVSAAVELLRGSPYYETLSHALKRYQAEQSLFPLEVALDLNYWRQLWHEVRRLPAKDRNQTLRIIGPLLDMNNLMWAIRYRAYHHLSEEELINYTLPFGYRVRDEDIRGIAAGADIPQVVSRIYPDLPDTAAMLQDIRNGLPRLELQLQHRIANNCRAAFVGDPFHIGIPVAYLVLHDLEIQDLVVLLEAKSSSVPLEDFRQYLVTGNGEKK